MKCAFLCGLSLILTIVPLHAGAAWGATAADLGSVMTFVTLLSLFVSPVAGLLADRVGRVPLAIGGSLTTALSVGLMPFATGRTAYYATRAAWATGEAFLITAYSTLALDVTPEEQRGARNSLDNQVGDLRPDRHPRPKPGLSRLLSPARRPQPLARHDIIQVGDIALLFLPLIIGVVGMKSFAAAFWLASGLMVGANLWITKLLKQAAA